MTPARLSIDLDALAANYRTLEALTGVPVQPVVKADAYGLGAATVARRLMAEGARAFFVARPSEGLDLRAALGPEPEIWVLDGCATSRACLEMVAADLRPVLNGPDQLQHWRRADGRPCGIHVDTGMNRLGFRPEQAPEGHPGVTLIMSHLACADEPGHPMNRVQRDVFAAVAARYPGATRSFANSGGCFLGSDYAFDAVRPGICLYGGGPEGRPDDRIRPVAAFTADVLQVRDVPAGESVGYSRGFLAERPMRVATVAAGYADGVLRSTSPEGQVHVAGELRPILGRISMDVLAVDVTGLDVGVDDAVELFGPNRLLDDAARAAGTVAWELLTSVGARVERRPPPDADLRQSRSQGGPPHLRVGPEAD